MYYACYFNNTRCWVFKKRPLKIEIEICCTNLTALDASTIQGLVHIMGNK